MSKPRIKKVGDLWGCSGMGHTAVGVTPNVAWCNWRDRVREANISALVSIRAKPWEYGPVRAG